MSMISRVCLIVLVALAISFSTSATFADQDTAPKVTAKKTADGSKVVIQVNGQPFTEYITLSGNKPIVWPIIGPTDKPMTRQWPMAEKGPDEKDDHIHHRSLWFTHEKVNGTNFWHEPKPKGKKGKKGKQKKTGLIKHREFVKIDDGNPAVIVTRNDWLSAKGKKILEDERTLRFGANQDTRWIDFDITLKATEGPVTFGDTKEGTMGIRVAGPLKPSAKKGAKLTNSNGQVNKKAWGKKASWIDYSGPLGEETVGITIMNHPSSFRYPTYWHARTYGLGAANPFGWSDFLRDKTADGSYTIPKGESITLKYRFLFHKGVAKEANLDKEFEQYSGKSKQGD